MARRLAGALAIFLLGAGTALAQAQITSTRIWPARDYTRVTLESKTAIKYQVFAVKDPKSYFMAALIGAILFLAT